MKKNTKSCLIIAGLILALPAYGAIKLYLDGPYYGIRTTASLEEAHLRAITSFIEGDRFGYSRFKRSVYWNDMMVTYDNREFHTQGIRLIGLTPEYGSRYFTDGAPNKKAERLNKSNRELTPPELDAIKHIRTHSTFAEIPEYYSDSSVTRIIAPIHAQRECLKCHDIELGELLGAMDYYLVEVETYEPKPIQSTDSSSTTLSGRNPDNNP